MRYHLVEKRIKALLKAEGAKMELIGDTFHFVEPITLLDRLYRGVVNQYCRIWAGGYAQDETAIKAARVKMADLLAELEADPAQLENGPEVIRLLRRLATAEMVLEREKQSRKAAALATA
jgi:hypothetical protein